LAGGLADTGARQHGKRRGESTVRFGWCKDARVHAVRSAQPIPVTPTSRQATARRLEAARVLAGRPSLRALAQQCGMRYSHLVALHTPPEPMTFTDARDLAAALDVPQAWLRYGWADA
jgi:hypothetical protein